MLRNFIFFQYKQFKIVINFIKTLKMGVSMTSPQISKIRQKKSKGSFKTKSVSNNFFRGSVLSKELLTHSAKSHTETTDNNFLHKSCKISHKPLNPEDQLKFSQRSVKTEACEDVYKARNKFRQFSVINQQSQNHDEPQMEDADRGTLYTLSNRHQSRNIKSSLIYSSNIIQDGLTRKSSKKITEQDIVVEINEKARNQKITYRKSKKYLKAKIQSTKMYPNIVNQTEKEFNLETVIKNMNLKKTLKESQMKSNTNTKRIVQNKFKLPSLKKIQKV